MVWDTVISLVAVAIVVLIFWKMPDDDEAWQDEPGAADGKTPEAAAPAPTAAVAPVAPTAPVAPAAPVVPEPTTAAPVVEPPPATPPPAASDAPTEPKQGA